jgi:hypothetical protein
MSCRYRILRSSVDLSNGWSSHSLGKYLVFFVFRCKRYYATEFRRCDAVKCLFGCELVVENILELRATHQFVRKGDLERFDDVDAMAQVGRMILLRGIVNSSGLTRLRCCANCSSREDVWY